MNAEKDDKTDTLTGSSGPEALSPEVKKQRDFKAYVKAMEDSVKLSIREREEWQERERK
jgi:hypothetical protein